MAELIDIMTTQDVTGAGGIDERQTFTVNTAGPLQVAMDVMAVGQGVVRPGNKLSYKVSQDEGIILQSIGLSLPYLFAAGNAVFSIEMFADDGITKTALLASGTTIQLPFVNYEMAMGLYVPWPAGLVAAYKISMEIFPASAMISMIGVDAALNAAVFPVTAFAKISHTLPLVP